MNQNKSKESEKHLTTTVKQSGVVFSGKIIGYFLGFASNFVIAKFYGPTIMGEYALVKTVISIGIIFTVFGFDKGLLKYISKYRGKNEEAKLKQIIKLAFKYGFILSVIGAISIFLLKGIIANHIFNDVNLINLLSYGAWVIIPLTLIRLFGGIYQGFRQLSPFVIAKNIIQKGIFILIISLCFWFGLKTTVSVIIAFFLACILALVFLTTKLRSLKLSIKEIFSVSSYDVNKKSFFTYSSTLILISFMGIILGKIDRVMLGIYKTSEMVGIYNIAVQITMLVNFFLASTNQVFSSVISELYSTNKLEMLEDLYSAITKWIIIVTLPVAMSMFFFSNVIMLFFGEEYIKGGIALIILAIGKFITVLPGANGYILNMSGNEKLILINNVVMAIINIIMNMILVPKFGMLGAALATAISISIVNIVKFFQVKSILNIVPYKRDYFHILINLFVVTSLLLVFKIFYNNIVGLIFVTTINIIISLVISYQFKSNLDNVVFEKIKKRIADKF